MTTAPLDGDLDRRRATVVFVDLLGATKLSAEAGIEPAYAIVTGCLGSSTESRDGTEASSTAT